MERLWAPWRLRYVEGEIRHRGCIFCEKPALGDDVGELILLRGRRAYLIMNLFPYNTGTRDGGTLRPRGGLGRARSGDDR
jgi:ATP adenylyltransferase